ncbi:MAG: hypothetical protein B5M53_04350 [Candidatus Cloacimonas sp. 4484_209]|nr:MAG: hypothetical protein B5M53_04350 [Candidatus Cloacimonas sp. 4484_209]
MRKNFLFFFIFLIPSLLYSDILLFYNNKKTSLTTATLDSWTYVSLNDLRKITETNYYFEKSLKKFYLVTPQHKITFVQRNPYYLFDGQPRRLFLPFVYTNNNAFISAQDVVSILKILFEKEVFTFSSLNSIVIGKETFNPDSLIMSKKDDKICLTLSSKSELITSVDDDGKGKLKLILYNAVVKPTMIPHFSNNGSIIKITLQQEMDRATLLVLYNYENIDKIEKELINPGPSIRLTFYKKKRKPVKKRKKTHFINKIVLDPGHGGKDSGAVGPTGLMEKTIALKIAKRLKKILEKKGLTVLMTRKKDKLVYLRERSHLANNSGADMFISIHCNASPRRKSAGGFETYFLSTAKTSWARAVEAKENSVIKFETPKEKATILEYILWDMAQNEYLRESSELAECIQESMGEKLHIESRGVKQANFYVMREIYMPSVLVETAFITNPEEEKLLKQESFRKKIAEGIADGIVKFKETYERKLNQ